MGSGFQVQRLEWHDPVLGSIALPLRPMEVRAGFGSGLSRRPGDAADVLWAIGDRGPNIKVATAEKLYGLTLAHVRDLDGAKIMPRLDVGPAMAELRLHSDRVELVRTLPLAGLSGRPLSGLPIPGGVHSECEPALDLHGQALEPDPSGLDSEGLAATADGGFWVSDEYGPSLLRVDPAGMVQMRWVPQGCEAQYDGASYSIWPVLPAIAAKRQINRGFEGLTLMPGGKRLAVAFQSPLANPDEETHERARHIRLWLLDASNGALLAQFLYPLDEPASFRRDSAEGEVSLSDLKVSEITALSDDVLLVLERGSKTAKFYRVRLDPALALGAEHLGLDQRPTVEELSGSSDFPLPVLHKNLVFTSDDTPEVAPDLEGMAVLSPSELLLVSDNDFGLEGAETSFWRVTFDEPVLAG